ncbi:MAG TPA: hypothetical protein VF581_04005 [Flavobacterium sp.]|jgi:hypothetical protein
MKSLNLKYYFAGLCSVVLFACNGRNNAGNTTAEGTELNDQRNHQNGVSVSGNVDSLTSPGSNAGDIKAGNVGTDGNMQNQSNTHGYDVQSGDNGTGSTGGTGATRGTTGTGSGSTGSRSTSNADASGSGR